MKQQIQNLLFVAVLLLYLTSMGVAAGDTLFVKDASTSLEIPSVLIAVGDTVMYSTIATSEPNHSKLFWSYDSGQNWDSTQTELTIETDQHPMRWVGMTAISQNPDDDFKQVVTIVLPGGRRLSFNTVGNGIPEDFYIQSLLLHPITYGRCFAIVNSPAAVEFQYLYVLDINQGTWKQVSVPVHTLGGGRQLLLELDYSDESVLWLRIDGDDPLRPVVPYDYLKSTNNGDTWELLQRPFRQLMGLFGSDIGVTGNATAGITESLVLENVITTDSTVLDWSSAISKALSGVSDTSGINVGFLGVGGLSSRWDARIFFDALKPDWWVVTGSLINKINGERQICRLATKDRGQSWNLFAGPTRLIHEDTAENWSPIPVLTNRDIILMPYYRTERSGGVSGPVTSSGLIRFYGVTSSVSFRSTIGSSVLVYPQPADTHISIEFEEQINPRDVLAINSRGEIRSMRYKSSSNLIQVDITEMNSGVYHLLIIGRKEYVSCRIVVTK